MSFLADKQGGKKQSRVANQGWIESVSTTHSSVQVAPLLGSMPIWCLLGMDHDRAWGELVALLRLQCCPSPTAGVSSGNETTEKQQWSNGMVIKIDKQTFCHLEVPSPTHFSLSIHCPMLVGPDPRSVRLDFGNWNLCLLHPEQLKQTDKVQANSNKACSLIWWQWGVKNNFTLITN